MTRNEPSRRGGAATSERSRAAVRDKAPKTSILLVDVHTVFRQGLRALVSEEPDLVVVGEAQDGRQAVELAQRLRPDVVVTDIAMPRLNGIEAMRQILDAAPATKVVVLTAHDDDAYVERVTALGAAGYVLKHASFEELATAIRTAKGGGTYVSASIAWREHSRVRWTPGAGSASATPTPAQLTTREAEVLQMIAEGACNKEMGWDLGISGKTVEKHRQSLMRKLDIHDVAGLTRYAIASGVVECCS